MMKKTISFISAFILLSVSIHAQIHLFLEEQNIELPDGPTTAWVFPITEDLEAALKDLNEFCKKRSDVKLKKDGKNLMIGEKLVVPAIATRRGDLLGYAYITEKSYNMALAFRLGYDIFLNSRDWSQEMENLRIYARTFMSYHYDKEYSRRMAEQENALNGIEKEKNQNINKINNLNKKVNSIGKKIGKENETVRIEAYEAEIRTLEADVKQLMDTLPELESKISNLKSAIEQNQTELHVYLGAIGAF